MRPSLQWQEFWSSAVCVAHETGEGTRGSTLSEWSEHLVTGDRLPSLYGTDMEGNEVDITASVAGRWAVVLFYRGDW